MAELRRNRREGLSHPHVGSGMRMGLSEWTMLAMLAGTVLVATLYGLALSGHFPAEQRTAEFRSPAGLATIWGTIPIVVVALLLALGRSWSILPWPAIVLAAGTAILVAPLVLQHLPDAFVDGRRGLAVLAAGAGVGTMLLLRSG